MRRKEASWRSSGRSPEQAAPGVNNHARMEASRAAAVTPVKRARRTTRFATCLSLVTLGASAAACGQVAAMLPRAYTDPHAPVPCPRRDAGAAPGALDARSMIGHTLQEAT